MHSTFYNISPLECLPKYLKLGIVPAFPGLFSRLNMTNSPNCSLGSNVSTLLPSNPACPYAYYPLPTSQFFSLYLFHLLLPFGTISFSISWAGSSPGGIFRSVLLLESSSGWRREITRELCIFPTWTHVLVSLLFPPPLSKPSCLPIWHHLNSTSVTWAFLSALPLKATLGYLRDEEDSTEQRGVLPWLGGIVSLSRPRGSSFYDKVDTFVTSFTRTPHPHHPKLSSSISQDFPEPILLPQSQPSTEALFQKIPVRCIYWKE